MAWQDQTNGDKTKLCPERSHYIYYVLYAELKMKLNPLR